MWRTLSFRTSIAAVLALLSLAPPSLGWRGVIDCARRCQLAATTGAHCPLMYGVHHSTSRHHCHEQQTTKHTPALRCACPQSSSPTASPPEGTHFLVPPAYRLLTVSTNRFAVLEPHLVILFSIIPPPDPPPRLASLHSA
ncbi:MAG: hypothetical protein FJ147_09515 [Deltaproteobacteria bacterium]|nr:hypothetical protein [Deltaproteobacteria bacterium]